MRKVIALVLVVVALMVAGSASAVVNGGINPLVNGKTLTR